MTPRLGQTVLFNFSGNIVPAQVTHVFNDTLINLNYFPEFGGSYSTVTSVSMGIDIGQWDYNFDHNEQETKSEAVESDKDFDEDDNDVEEVKSATDPEADGEAA